MAIQHTNKHACGSQFLGSAGGSKQFSTDSWSSESILLNTPSFEA